MTTTDLRLQYLDEDEAEWVYAHFPWVGRSPDDYCPTCDKKGIFRWKGQDFPCDCELQLQLLKHYLSANIGVPYQRLDWDDVANAALIDQIEKYRTNPEYMRRGIGLLLLGEVGVGKTLIGTLCLKDFIKTGTHCFATLFTEMITNYTASWRSETDRNRFQHKIIESQVLLIDDIGKETEGAVDLATSTFDYVLRTRVHHGRSTIVTTNLDGYGLRPRYGDAVVSLLREKSMIVPVTDTDFRRNAHDRELAEIAAGETRPIR